MRHVYHCPVRWADLDLLGHVNNVVYVDYLQEARVDFMRALLPPRSADMAEGVVVVRHEVSYLAPMGVRFRPVGVECWVTQVRAATFTLAYEVFDEDDGIRTVYLRATTVLTPYVFADERPRRLAPEEKDALGRYLEPPDAETSARVRLVSPARDGAFRWPLHVRFSDVDYLAPILLREAPYDVWSQIAKVGTRSMTIDSEIADGDRTLARGRVTVVFFDTATQRSAEPPAVLRELLLAST